MSIFKLDQLEGYTPNASAAPGSEYHGIPVARDPHTVMSRNTSYMSVSHPIYDL